MLALLRRRNFALLWFAGAVSTLGDWTLLIALPFFVYDLTGSALATGATFAAQTLPRVFLSPIAGVFVDRWDRQRTLIVADVARGLLLLLLLLVRSPDALPLVYLVAAAQASIAQFFLPAKSALLPRIVAEGELLPANSLSSLCDNLTRLVGPALGGLLYGALGLSSVVLLDAASFLVSGALLALIRTRNAECGTRNDEVRTQASEANGQVLPLAHTPFRVPRSAFRVWDDLLAGLRIVGRSRLLTGLFAIGGAVMIGEGLFVSLLVPFTKEVLGGDARELGWLMSAQAVGGIAGGLLIGRLGARIAPLRLLALGGLLDGALILAIVNGRSLALALPLIALAGVPVVALFVSGQTLLQAHSEDHFRGRVFGAFSTVSALAMLVGMALAGALTGPLGIVATLSISGVMNILAGCLALALRPAPAPPSPAVAGGVSAPLAGD